MAKSSAICDGLVRYGRSQPLFDHSFKLIGVSCYPDFRGGKHIGYECVSGARFGRKGSACEDVGIDFASKSRGERAEPGGERTQPDISDHEQVHIARGTGGSCRGRAKHEGHLDAGHSGQSVGKLFTEPGRFEGYPLQFGENWIPGVGPVVKAVPIPPGDRRNPGLRS